jgi:ATP-binding cassette, subfamily F, member 3
MSLLAARELFVQLGTKIIFDGDDASVEPGDRLGIVGPNGSGKSTLLRLFAGQMEPEGGEIVRQRGLRVGYLAQELPEADDVALLDSVLAGAPGKAAIAERIEQLEQALEGDTDPVRHAELAARLADLHVEHGDLERRFAPHRAAKILIGLGFTEAQFRASLREFSGGWRMRAELARLLFEQPEVLLLDEPTNHLDMPSVAWLDRFLDSFPSALVLICHDRTFLNRHVRRVLSFEVEGLRAYKGDYDEYKRLRALELEHLEARAKKDEAKRKDLEAFVERFRAKATKARQAQSKMRLIEKMQENAVEIPKPRRTIALDFPPPPKSSDPVCEIEGLGHSYGAKRVFSGFDGTVRERDRIAIVGLNGAGKTTLLRLLAGELTLAEGKAKFGVNVEKRYFAQHHSEALRREATILEEVWAVAPQLGQSQVRGILGAFLFSDDEVEKSIGVLSGGEKARVALAKLLVRPGNVLLLDEPTNHLDTESAQRLTESLQRFAGTILFVSHNLDFAKALATKVWDVRDGRVIAYPGTLADYLDKLHRDQDDAAARFAADDDSPGSSRGPSQEAKAERVLAREDEKQKKRRREKLTRRIAELETTLAALEAEKSQLDVKLGDAATWQDPEVANAASRRHAEVVAAIEAGYAEWERANEEIAAG